MNSFSIVDETGKLREANVLLNFEFESDKYCLYSIKRDSESYNLFVSKLIFHNKDNIVLVDLDSESKQEIDNIIHYIVKNPDYNLLKKARIGIVDDIFLDNINNLLFTTYKTYLFSVKQSFYFELRKKLNQKKNSADQLGFNSLISNNKKNPKSLESSIDKNVESFETEDGLDDSKEIIKKINIEKLNITDGDDLEKLFVKERIKTPDSNKGFISSNITLLILGMSSFILILLLYLINFN